MGIIPSKFPLHLKSRLLTIVEAHFIIYKEKNHLTK
uniref:Uncharacterized protein n=1 Tax=Rhizophora mucronata TaxID=61149 RepID=A0A2P2NQ98_RHIMU